MLCSCASKQPGTVVESIEFESVRHYDVSDKTIYITYMYPDLDKRFQEYKKANLINKDSTLSCFGSASSINYVNISIGTVPQFRQFTTPSKYKSTYKTVNVLHNGQYRNLYVEHRVDKLEVEQSICYKTFNGQHVQVISELYSYID
jgi:hypothetical protein